MDIQVLDPILMDSGCPEETQDVSRVQTML